MNRSPTFIPIAVVIFAGLFLTACAGAPIETASPSPTPEPAGQAGAIAVVDAQGRTVNFAEPPQRIVVAGKSSLTIVNTLFLFPEAQDRVLALVAGRQNPGDFLQLVDPGFEAKTILEVDAGPEQIAPLDPDVVILRSFMADSLGAALEELDLPLVYVDLETPEQYFRDVATLGQLFGNEARAEEIQAFYQSRLERVSQAMEGMSGDEKPRVLIVQYSDQGGEVAFNVPSVSWLQTMEAELAGGVPVWVEAAQSGGWTVVNFEQIAAWDPDQVFVISYNADPSKVAQELKADSQWQKLRVMGDEQVYGYAADYYSWDQPDPRWILGLSWLAGKVHPDRLPGLDVMEEVSQFYGQMYGLDEATIREQVLPKLKGDVE